MENTGHRVFRCPDILSHSCPKQTAHRALKATSTQHITQPAIYMKVGKDTDSALITQRFKIKFELVFCNDNAFEAVIYYKAIGNN